MATNHLGPFLLTLMLLPALRASATVRFEGTTVMVQAVASDSVNFLASPNVFRGSYKRCATQLGVCANMHCNLKFR